MELCCLALGISTEHYSIKNYKLHMKKKLLKLSSILLSVLFTGSLAAQTAGTLTFTYTPVSHTGYSGTKNALAVWIQTSAGGFVKTKLRYAGAGNGTSDHLPTWAANSGGTAANCMATACNKTDATTGATLANYTVKTITWDAKNVNGTANGTVVADGVYKVTIESTWNHGSTGTSVVSYSFTKGPNAVHLTPANDANFTNIKLDWIPASTAGIDDLSEDQAVAVYPNPTEGIFNVDYKKANAIRVINILGTVVAEEQINEAAGPGTKSMDLSNFANGIYWINVSNSAGSRNYKIVLNK
jgi:hypothetical protein